MIEANGGDRGSRHRCRSVGTGWMRGCGWGRRAGPVAVVLALAACGGGDAPEAAVETGTRAAEAAVRPTVVAVNYPLAYMAERIGGAAVTVGFPAPPDVDPAMWSPDPDVVARYQGADLILLNGAGYAGWVDRVSLPETRLVNTTAGQEDRYVTEPGAVTHSHGPEGEHSHDEIAFTTWLDPVLAVEQARALARAMSERWPDRAADFAAGLEALEGDLRSLDAAQEAGVGEGADEPVLGSHPVYQYLAARYSLNLRSVHFEPDAEPDPAAWRDLAALLREHPARWMLWEAEPLPGVRARLLEMGVESVVYDPAGNRPETGDYLSVMEANARALSTVYGDGDPAGG